MNNNENIKCYIINFQSYTIFWRQQGFRLLWLSSVKFSFPLPKTAEDCCCVDSYQRSIRLRHFYNLSALFVKWNKSEINPMYYYYFSSSWYIIVLVLSIFVNLRQMAVFVSTVSFIYSEKTNFQAMVILWLLLLGAEVCVVPVFRRLMC